MRIFRFESLLMKSTHGTSMIIFTAAFTLIALCAALTIDIGLIVLEKSRLASSVDAAVLAGVQELVSNESNAENIAQNYMAKNIDALQKVDISSNFEKKSMTITSSKVIGSIFAKIIGNDSFTISATSKAMAQSIISMNGARPLAIVDQIFSYGALYTLKEGSGGGTTGNYAAISLGGTGSSVYEDNLLYGYHGIISVGDLIQTETGNIAGKTNTSILHLIDQCDHQPECTYAYYNRNCKKIIFVPVVNTLDVNGKKYVKVLGFATFYLEGVTLKAGQADVMGRFITYRADGETSNDVNDYGTYGIQLVR